MKLHEKWDDGILIKKKIRNSLICNSGATNFLTDEHRELRKEKSNNKYFDKFLSSDLSVLNKNKSTTASSHNQATNKRDYYKGEISLLLKEINKITKKMDDDDKESEKALEWKFAGMVIDKLCLYLFSTLTLILTCSILFSAENFFKFK
jgi:hypothetical protein